MYIQTSIYIFIHEFDMMRVFLHIYIIHTWKRTCHSSCPSPFWTANLTCSTKKPAPCKLLDIRHPRRLRRNLKITSIEKQKSSSRFQTLIFGFHVDFLGCGTCLMGMVISPIFGVVCWCLLDGDLPDDFWKMKQSARESWNRKNILHGVTFSQKNTWPTQTAASQ